MSSTQRVKVAIETPQHAGLDATLDYLSEQPLLPGTLVRAPLGKRELLGIVWAGEPGGWSEAELRPLAAVLSELPPLDGAWQELVAFASGYYQRSLGELALSVLPPELHKLDGGQLALRLRKLHKALAQPAAAAADTPPAPSPEQAQVLADLEATPAALPVLLHGVTGSGKTEVYLHAAARALEAGRQALVLVPEINLTPQLEARFAARFAGRRIVSLHSGLTPAQRLRSWLAAHLGLADLVLGTRLAIFTPMPRLGLIVVDEEHDPSYKQQEGARYSARDLAIYRARLQDARVLLGSATPSLESWQRANEGRYRRLALPSRIGGALLPRVRVVDMNQQPKDRGGAALSPPLLEAIRQRIARGEQSLVFLNRRGYAPVLHCADCDWKSDCPHCSAHQVFHRNDRTLRCHHCSYTTRVPRACPGCGSPDITAIGHGTEQLEEQLSALLAGVLRPDGQPVKVARIDADTTKLKGALQTQLAQVHSGEIDVLIGTQMVAKGHDFRRITLVAAVQPDGALFSSDFRAAERLFALLLQASGRAGRDAQYVAAQGSRSEMWLQTFHPEHALFAALRQHDYPAFAAQQLQERRDAAMPPFAFQALVRADARTQEAAQGFLQAASDAARAHALAGLEHVTLYPPVPLTIQRVANVERAQMLLESPSRPALQRFLAGWQPLLHATRSQPEHKSVVRWLIDVDPLAI